MPNRRSLLAAAAGAALTPLLAAHGQETLSTRRRTPASAATHEPGPVLLTVSGAIQVANRGALDPALDQMMAKQKLRFSRALAFRFDDLLRFPAHQIRPTLEYDKLPHTLSGPLLADVVGTSRPDLPDPLLLLRAVDGYAVSIKLSQAAASRFIIATHLDGQTMPLGGLGPLWAIFDADRDPAMQSRPLAQRFQQCPWALYHIDVRG
jgi:hypothetical protein